MDRLELILVKVSLAVFSDDPPPFRSRLCGKGKRETIRLMMIQGLCCFKALIRDSLLHLRPTIITLDVIKLIIQTLGGTFLSRVS